MGSSKMEKTRIVVREVDGGYQIERDGVPMCMAYSVSEACEKVEEIRCGTFGECIVIELPEFFFSYLAKAYITRK